jgi:imidazolonepropionase-like amidohydrolase
MRSVKCVWSLAVLLAVFSLFSCSSESAPPPKAAAKVIVGGTLIDGTPRPHTPNAVIVVADGKIIAAGPESSVTIPEGAERTNASGLYVTPGRGGLIIAPGAEADLLLVGGNPIENPDLLGSPMRRMQAGQWTDAPKN